VLADETSVHWLEAVCTWSDAAECTVVSLSCSQPPPHRFSWFYSVFKQTLRRFPNSKLLMQPSEFQFIRINPLTPETTKLPSQLRRHSINQSIKIPVTLFLTILTSQFSCYFYEKDKREPSNKVTLFRHVSLTSLNTSYVFRSVSSGTVHTGKT
jgi:hypothetical protein